VWRVARRAAGRKAGGRARDEGELQDLLPVARRRLGGVQLRDRRGAGALGRVEVLPLERPHAQLRLVEVRVRRAWQGGPLEASHVAARARQLAQEPLRLGVAVAELADVANEGARADLRDRDGLALA